MFVALVAFPRSDPVMEPTEKLPEASLATIEFAVFAFVAVVALLDTFPAVVIVARLLSGRFAIEVFSEMLADPLKETAGAVAAPVIEIFLAVCSVVAVDALPVRGPTNDP
jgi:hypothetical protein